MVRTHTALHSKVGVHRQAEAPVGVPSVVFGWAPSGWGMGPMGMGGYWKPMGFSASWF